MTGTAKNQNALLALFDRGCVLTLNQMEQLSGIKRHEVIKTAGRLINRGYVDRLENGVFRLSDEGLDAKLQGVEIRSGPTGPDTKESRTPFRNSLRQVAWDVMNIVQVFSINDLVALSVDATADDTEVQRAHHNLNKYCRALVSTEFLMEMPTRERGIAIESNGFKRYRLLNYTGEIAPTYRNRKNEVFDHNTRKVHPCLL